MKRNRMLRGLMCVNVAVVLWLAGCANSVGSPGPRRNAPGVTGWKNWGQGADNRDNKLYPVGASKGSDLQCAVVQIASLKKDRSRTLDPRAELKEFGSINVDGKHLEPDVWPDLLRGLKMLEPACSGVVFQNKSRILTAAHCEDRLLRNRADELYVLAGRTADGDESEEYQLYRVDRVSRFLHSATLDIMVLELEQGEEIQGACPMNVARSPVKNGDSVIAQFHPFGLPQLRSDRATVAKCGETMCTAKFDNGTGGSGGLIVNEQNELVGIVRGRLGHKHRGKFYTLPRRSQPFTRASVIVDSSNNVGKPKRLRFAPKPTLDPKE